MKAVVDSVVRLPFNALFLKFNALMSYFDYSLGLRLSIRLHIQSAWTRTRNLRLAATSLLSIALVIALAPVHLIGISYYMRSRAYKCISPILVT